MMSVAAVVLSLLAAAPSGPDRCVDLARGTSAESLLVLADCYRDSGRAPLELFALSDAVQAFAATGTSALQASLTERITTLKSRLGWVAIRTEDKRLEGLEVTVEGLVVPIHARPQTSPVSPGNVTVLSHTAAATEPLSLHVQEGQTLVLLAKADSPLTRITLELEPRPANATKASLEAFAQGRKQLRNSQWKDAETSFAEAYRLEPAVGTLLNIAECLDRENQAAKAWAIFGEVTEWAHRIHDATREKMASARMLEVQKSLSTLEIKVAPNPAAIVTVNGAEFAANAVRPVTPGQQTVVISSPGYVDWKTTLEIRGPPTVVLQVPPLVTIADSLAAHTALTVESPVKPAQSSLRARAWIPLVAAGALAASGGLCIASANLDYQSLNRLEERGTWGSPDSIRRAVAGETKQTVGWVLIGAAGAAVLTSGLMFVLGAPADQPTVTLVPARDGATLSLTGTF